jgi:hypothetical protein
MLNLLVASSFQGILEDCIEGRISKEQALGLLKIKYDSAHINIKDTLGKDHISFCSYVPCEFNEWIKICDGAERHNPAPNRIGWDNKIQQVIDKVTAKYKENDLEYGKVFSEVYAEVHQIQNFCRENREIEGLYKECRVKIEKLPDNEKKADESLRLEGTSENTQNEIENVIKLLINTSKVVKREPRKIKDKTLPEEYWINTSVNDVLDFLTLNINVGTIKITEPITFMKTYLKGKKGGLISDSFKTEKSKTTRKTKVKKRKL